MVYQIQITPMSGNGAVNITNNTDRNLVVISGANTQESQLKIIRPGVVTYPYSGGPPSNNSIVYCSFALTPTDVSLSFAYTTFILHQEYHIPMCLAFFYNTNDQSSSGKRRGFISYIDSDGVYQKKEIDMYNYTPITINFSDGTESGGLSSLKLNAENIAYANYDGMNYTTFPVTIPLSSNSKELTIKGQNGNLYTKVNGVWVESEKCTVIT